VGSGGGGGEGMSRFGRAAGAFLTGMFSKQATDKLDEVFTTLFKTSPASGDAQRKDKLSTTPPTISAIVPSPAHVGVAMLTIEGTNFTDTTFLSINGHKLDPKLVSPTRLPINLPSDLNVTANLPVTAIDGGRPSAPVTLQIIP